MLIGARQVGKTWSLKELGRSSYTNCVHIDFERHPEYRQFFTLTKEPRRIIENLSIATGSPINPENTLLIFDEIQECPEALESLKYFCEDTPDYHVACAGSLLGIHLAEDISYPVGKVNVMNMYLLDVGLLRNQSGLAPSAFAEGDRLFREFKGAFAENFIAQELAVQFGRSAHYWAMDNPRYEVDFILQHENVIIPIEVKSGENVQARSLRKYRERYPKETPIAIRYSLRNVSFDDGLLNIPLFMVGETKRILDTLLAR